MNSGDMENAGKVISEGAALAESTGDLNSKAYLIFLKCELLLRKSDYVAVKRIIKKSLIELNKLPDRIIKAKMNVYLGLAHYRLAQFDNALDYLVKALEYTEKTDDEILEASVHLNIGNTLLKMQNFEKAHDHFQTALSKAQKKNHTITINDCTSALAGYYYYKDDFEKAYNCFSDLVDISEKRGDKNGQLLALVNSGSCLKRLERFEEAFDYLIRSQKLAKELENQFVTANSTRFIAEIYLEWERYEEALPLIEEALSIATKIDAKDLILDIYYVYSNYYVKQGDYRNAYENLSTSIEILADIFDANAQNQVLKLEAKYKTEQKEREAEIFRLKNVELVETNQKLQEALDNVKLLSGLVPICANCKNIRDDKGYWNNIEHYISEHSDMNFSHGICPECLAKLYPDISERLKNQS